MQWVGTFIAVCAFRVWIAMEPMGLDLDHIINMLLLTIPAQIGHSGEAL